MSGDDEKQFPGESDEAWPEVFTKAPSMPTTLKPGQVSKEQLERFYSEGYLVVNDLFTREELQPARDDLVEMVEELAQKLYKHGKIKKLYKELGLFKRLTMIDKEFPGANILLHKFGKMPKGFQDVWTNEKMLNLVEQLLGSSEITGNPVWNLRPKTPKNEPSTVPWHQDNSYYEPSAYRNLIITGWIPLLDATEFNGCLQVVKNGHRPGKIATHQCCHGGTWYTMLEPEEMEKTLGVDMEKDLVTCEVPMGGVLLFSNMLPHRSLNNLSSDIRWSLDLRWQKTGSPISFFGLKDGVQMRDEHGRALPIDWEAFNSTNRNDAQLESLGIEVQEFDLTIQGPWMKQWEIVHVNKHTDAFEKQNAPISAP